MAMPRFSGLSDFRSCEAVPDEASSMPQSPAFIIAVGLPSRPP